MFVRVALGYELHFKFLRVLAIFIINQYKLFEFITLSITFIITFITF